MVKTFVFGGTYGATGDGNWVVGSVPAVFEAPAVVQPPPVDVSSVRTPGGIPRAEVGRWRWSKEVTQSTKV